LLAIVEELRTAFPKKRFTLDGRLVGDIGEALAEQIYALTVFDRFERHHDAKADDGRLVLVKATMQGTLTFPADHIPECYLGLSIDATGTATEVFNGPGSRRAEQSRARRRPDSKATQQGLNLTTVCPEGARRRVTLNVRHEELRVLALWYEDPSPRRRPRRVPSREQPGATVATRQTETGLPCLLSTPTSLVQRALRNLTDRLNQVVLWTDRC
jgi:hypothetical protein